MSDLQELVDDLSATLRRPVGVDDRRFRAMAYSSHVDGVDPVRLASILQRRAPVAVTDWLESLGIASAEEYVRVPANGDLGMAARVCVPLRVDQTLLGYLWLIDEPEALTTAELDTTMRFSESVGAALYRTSRLESAERVRALVLLRRMFGLAPGDPADAARELLADAMLASAGRFAAIAVAPVGPVGDTAPDTVRVRLAAALEQLRRALPPRHMRVLVDRDLVAAVVALDAGDDLTARGETVRAAVAEALEGVEGWSAVIGIGAARERLEELPGSHAEARHAIELGRTVVGLGPLVVWDDLGAYRTLALLAGADEGAAPLPASLERLLSHTDAATLVPTLERYLDHAGEARPAAAELYIHRSSLYQRLRRIEEIAGVELSSGDDRLELHLGLRLRRMRGAVEP